MVGGSVDRDENAIVEGKIESIEIEKLNRLLPGIAKAFRFPGKLPGKKLFTGIFSLAILVVLYILNLLILLIFPNGIEKIVDKIQENIWIPVAIGIGIEILFLPLILLFTVSIIGIPLIPILILTVFIAGIFGFSGISLIIGKRVSNSLNWQISNRLGMFSLGWLAIMIIPILGTFLCGFGLVGTIISILGLVMLYVTMTIGLGGVLYALVKGKKED